VTNLITIPFYEDRLIAVAEPREGMPMVPARQFCERLGLDWKTQYRKIMARESFYGVVIMTTPSDGGEQETICLPLSKLPVWLLSIHPGKVKPELRATLERFQNEAADVLYRHFFGKAKAADTPAPFSEHDMTLLARVTMGRIAEDERLERQGRKGVGRHLPTQEQIAEIRARYVGGMTPAEITAISGWPPMLLGALLDLDGWSLTTPSWRVMTAAGATARELAKADGHPAWLIDLVVRTPPFRRTGIVAAAANG
jgi:hypothetical protein